MQPLSALLIKHPKNKKFNLIYYFKMLYLTLAGPRKGLIKR